MNKNIRIAKSLVRIAKELLLDDKLYIARSTKVKEGQKEIIKQFVRGLPDTDKEGAIILTRWLSGIGDWENAPLGDYLMKDEFLRKQLAEKLDKIIEEFNSGSSENMAIQVPAFNIEVGKNGYNTGYQYLHGTDMSVGGFQMEVELKKIPRKGTNKPESIQIKVKCVWNDIIDANGSYSGEKEIADFVKEMLILPKDFIIRIPFKFETFWIKRDGSGSWEKKGYPWEKTEF